MKGSRGRWLLFIAGLFTVVAIALTALMVAADEVHALSLIGMWCGVLGVWLSSLMLWLNRRPKAASASPSHQEHAS